MFTACLSIKDLSIFPGVDSVNNITHAFLLYLIGGLKPNLLITCWEK